MNRWTILAAAAALPAAAVPAIAPASETVTFGYDVHGRLIKISHAGNATNGIQAEYSYDRADNREAKTVTNVAGGAGAVTFSVKNVSAVQGQNLVFTVTKSGTTAASHSVSYATADDEAIGGSDYSITGGTLSFAPAESSKTVTVPTANDGDGEETLRLKLSAPSTGTEIVTGSAIGTILAKAVNSPPSTTADAAGITRCATQPVIIVLTDNDSDPQGVILTGVSSGAFGEASVVTAASPTSVRYAPYDNGIGTDKLTYTVRDSLGAESQGLLTVEVSEGTCPGFLD
jgi:hypothetical protein